MNKMCVVLSLPLFLSGCMMLGMGGMGLPGGSGMHGASRSSSMNGPTLVKESVVNELRITAEFPPYMLGDQLAYRVTVRNVSDESAVPNASVALIVTVDGNRHPDSASGHAGSVSRRADSSTTPGQGTVGQMVVAPDEAGDGAYVFHPAITTEGAYRFVFVLERVGDVALATPIEVQHTVKLLGPRDPHTGASVLTTRSVVAPTLLIGAGVMAIMMLFMLR